MTHYPPLPRYIAICANPNSGKTTAAELLEELYGYTLVDDGEPMRDFAIRHMGADRSDVYSQEGKLRTTTINGQEMQWRDALGRLGNVLEREFGADVIPEMAYNKVQAGQRVVFASVRREQGLYHRKRGALVLEISNKSAGPSPYEFDSYNRDHCHLTINNDFPVDGLAPAQARHDLALRLQTAVEEAHNFVRGLVV